ncbi:copper amine oxidase N-terminal domain-containing protein [Paenibacillus sp. NPDC058071]|uniref:copper amine oxidase N-terminal domain-containing protein n=1 Tax=Paenibacillus sp. NPDC058071 TaxID=3346326 RepID=UPI0036D89B62
MKKSFIAIMVVFILAWSMPVMAAAAKAEETSVYVNGTKVKYAQAPLTEKGTTIVSARETIESLGLTFTWDSSNKRIIGSNGEMTLSIVLGAPTATVNGVSVFLGTPAVERNGRMMVPLRFLLDGLGASMETKGSQIKIKTAPKEKSRYYTGLPLEITNTTVKNLGTDTVKVNYVEYIYLDDKMYTVDYSISLGARKKGVFEHSSATPGDDVVVDNEEHIFFGRAVKSIEVDGKEIASKGFQKAEDAYLDRSFENSLRKYFEKQWAEYQKSLKQELVKNKNVPFKIRKYSISYDTLGYPDANISLLNLTDKRIVSFELSFSCYDAYGDKVNGLFSNSNRFYGLGNNVSVKSGESFTFTWSLSEFGDTASLKNIQIDKVAFSDGTYWKRK